MAATDNADSGGRKTISLGLDTFVQRVLDHNESLQIEVMEVMIKQKEYEGERGLFEPDFVGSYDHIDSERPNTVEQQRNLLGASVFDQENNIYSAGIEAVVPSGARVRLGPSLRDLNNNLQDQPSRFGAGQTGQEYVGSFGLNVVQPLLRNGGVAATMANIRIAAASSDIAFQQYRRRLMEIVTTAVASYWELYYAQEQVDFYGESVEVAQTLLEDRQEAFKVGRVSELQVLEARSGLALRRSRKGDAQQRLVETANRLVSLYSGSVLSKKLSEGRLKAVDEPSIFKEEPSYFESWKAAFDHNPDYLERRRRMVREKIRLVYAKNQRLPKLDLKASYGLNGLGKTPGKAFGDIEQREFPDWSIGLEMRIPLGGGIKERKALQAAKLRKRQSLVGLKQIESQIANSLDTAIWKVRRTAESVTNYQDVVGFYEDVLDTQLKQLEVGKIDSQTVLESEEKLFEARNSLANSLVEHQRSLLEWNTIKGTILEERGLDLDKEALLDRTSNLLARNGRAEERLDDLEAVYRRPPTAPEGGMSPKERERARKILRKEMRKQRSAEKEPSANRDSSDKTDGL